MNPLLAIAYIISYNAATVDTFNVTGFKVHASRDRVTSDDLHLNEMSKHAGDAFRLWEAGGDVAETVGTLRQIVAGGLPTERYRLARVLQAEGRTQEAATEFWRASYRKSQSGEIYSPNEGNVGLLVRAADCLEDVGRTEEAAWLFAQTHQKDRREAYLQATFSSTPSWSRKWMRKLLRENPKDVEAKRYLDQAEARIAYEAKNEPWTKSRDVPRE